MFLWETIRVLSLVLVLQSSFSLALSIGKIDELAGRRKIFKNAFLVTGSVFVPSIIGCDKANALEQCRSKARNCVRTVWTAPASLNKQDAIEIIRDVLNTYPQKGQNGIDCGGWSIVKDSMNSSTDEISSLTLEFKSCVGPAALAINLAQPFIDDVKIEIVETDVVNVQVKSSSRMGSSDLFVNKRRIDYLGDQLRQQGWAIPEVKYGQ